MITNAGVTIWHRSYDKISRMDVYQKQYFSACSLQKDHVVNLTDGGLQSADVLKIRIPTDETIFIQNGDKLMIGKSDLTAPPKEDAYTVTGYADNRKGSKQMRHWKVTAG